MTAAELALVVGAVLCAIAFAALAVTLVRVRDTLSDVRAEAAAMRAEATEVLAGLRQSATEARDAVSVAVADVDRFDRILGSAEAISAAVGRTNRLTRAALSTPVIKATGIVTGTSRAVRKLRNGA
jgi:uncharacterized protein YoxC